MFNFVYESKVEYANIYWHVVFIDWLKNIFFDEFIDFFLFECDELEKRDVYNQIEFKNDNENE